MDLRAAELVCGKIERVEKDLKRGPALVFETIKAYEARATIRYFFFSTCEEFLSERRRKRRMRARGGDGGQGTECFWYDGEECTDMGGREI
jgi:hypothetical protein